MSSFFCSFFSVFQMNFFLSLQKKHYHNLFLFPLPPLTFSVYLYFYLLVPIQCIFIIVSLFLLSLSPPFPLLCPCSTSIEIRRKYFHLTREEQIERALCIKKVTFFLNAFNYLTNGDVNYELQYCTQGKLQSSSKAWIIFLFLCLSFYLTVLCEMN